MFSKLFINRPILATVVSLVIVIAGGVSVANLPIAQYPQITPPTVKVSTNYPGANAETVGETVATNIEQEVNGVEGMLYMSSVSANDGSYELTVTFEVGTNLDMAQVLVQNRVSTALPKLPSEVNQQGVTTKKQSSNIILFITVFSDDPNYTSLDLSNYLSINVRDEISRIKGVGDASVLGGSDYSMRVWLDPNKLKQRKLTTDDVIKAIDDYNNQRPAGQIGAPPTPAGQSHQYTINFPGRLKTEDEFKNIIVAKGNETGIVRIKDIGRVKLGAQTYFTEAQAKGRPTGLLAIYQLPGANALEVADKVRAKLKELEYRFEQDGIQYDIPFDTTRFVKASIAEVYTTLFQAAALVFVVIFVFLQDWRATLIPAIAIPVSLIGTFAVMAGMGFSINMLTLFGLVLAIGIVVDDAIVVVESCSRHIDETGLDPKAAAIRTMQEVTGPVIATTLVLLAVFVPSAFMPGITGQMYKQFALTISVATVFSSINALTMTPAMAALLLRPKQASASGFVYSILNTILYRPFNFAFGVAEASYTSVVRGILRIAVIVMLLYGGLVFLGTWGMGQVPTGFLPTEDQGYVMASIQLPSATSLERTKKTMTKIDAILEETPGVESWVSLSGYSLLDAAANSNSAALWIIMKPWDERGAQGLSQKVILQDLQKRLAKVQDGIIFTFVPPAIEGLGVSGGFQMQLQSRGGGSLQDLDGVAQEMVQAGNSQSRLQRLNSTFRANVPQLDIKVDTDKAQLLGIPKGRIGQAMQAYLGSAYINDFTKFGRTYQVRVQADTQYRLTPNDIEELYVRSDKGEMVPLGSLVQVKPSFGPQLVNRYNLYPSAAINGGPAPGVSSGEALSLMEQMAKDKLPSSMSYEWTGMAYQEKQVGSEATQIFILAVLLVFLVLAAQYESWSAPFAVILAVPLALLGVLGALVARGMDNNVYTQIGLVLLIALASKNAILIVEFARELRAKGSGLFDSAVEASKLRFRPILMTSISSLLGFFPLVIATGAGAASRQSIGTVVVGGMAAATIFTVLFVPVFYLLLQGLGEFFSKPKPSSEGESAPTTETPSEPVVPPIQTSDPTQTHITTTDHNVTQRPPTEPKDTPSDMPPDSKD
ncbi:MAG: efflux RND transporter permease subunit [Gemmataceae bacterium]